MILDDPISFSIAGDTYDVEVFVPGEGYVAQKATIGPEYGGVFMLRYKNMDDETAIQNKLQARFMLGTTNVRKSHLNAVLALLTLQECRLGTGDKGGLPDWCDFKKLGSSTDEQALVVAYEKFHAQMEARKKDSAVAS